MTISITDEIKKQLGKTITIQEEKSDIKYQVLALELIPSAYTQFYWNEYSSCARAVFFYKRGEVQQIPPRIHSYFHEINGVKTLLKLESSDRYNTFILGDKKLLVIEYDNVHFVEPIYYALEKNVEVDVLWLPSLELRKFTELELMSVRKYKQDRDVFFATKKLPPKSHILTDTTYCTNCSYSHLCK